MLEVKQMNFSQVVKARMKQKGMNAYDLASRIGYSPAHVYRLIKGENVWTQKTINLTCKALDLTIEVKPSDGGDLQVG
jgi:DNA-binding Xre family transcriptional regulator